MPNSGAKHATLKGAGGGSWGPCTHLVKYGLNVEPRYAKSLAALLQAQSSAPAAALTAPVRSKLLRTNMDKSGELDASDDIPNVLIW